jgi:radical SAM superfamily enzyme YgiQ (UPF0313 family)
MKCGFCEAAQTKVKRTSLEKICQELDDIKSLGYRAVYIFDDIFAMSYQTTKKIADEFKKRDLIYRCNGQARMMTEQTMRMLAETGCAEIAFGAESGSQKILDNINKNCTVEENQRFVKLAHQFGIKLKLYIMLGLPGETIETMKQTERFIADSQPADVQLAIYYPYRGTPIREAIERKEPIDLKIKGEGLGAYGQKGGESECIVSTSELTANQIKEFRDKLVKKYINRGSH